MHQHRAKRVLSALVTISFVASPGAFAQAPAAPAEEPRYEFEYPELLVTPPASARLAMEAKTEARDAWTSHASIQASALATFVTGFMGMRDDGPDKNDRDAKPDDGEKPDVYYAGLASTLIGGGWLATTVALSAVHRPYQAGMAAIKPMGAKSKQDRLARERVAEEHLLAPATLSKRLKWLSVVSNALASAAVAGTAGDDLTKVVGGISTLAAFGPLVFPGHAEQVGDLHRDYKKKIYGPVADGGLRIDPRTGRLSPAMTLAWHF